MVVGGGDNGSCCSCGGANGWFFFFFFKLWWPAIASRGCRFVKKVVGFQRKGETDKKREKEERKKHT